jgi:hypothetical protein
MVEEQKKKDEDWMQKKWRPAMGWMYMLVCFFDMVIFPILWALIQSLSHQQLVQWNPLTLQGAGLFHIAMGAVLGIAAFGRTQEKLAGTAANPTATTQTTNTNMTGVPSGMGMNSGMGGGFGGAGNGGFGGSSMGSTPTFGAPQTGGFGAPSNFGSPAPTSSFPTPPASGFGATPAPFNQGATSRAAVAAPVTNPAANTADPSVDLGLHPEDPPARNTRSDGIETEGTI